MDDGGCWMMEFPLPPVGRGGGGGGAGSMYMYLCVCKCKYACVYVYVYVVLVVLRSIYVALCVVLRSNCSNYVIST